MAPDRLRRGARNNADLGFALAQALAGGGPAAGPKIRRRSRRLHKIQGSEKKWKSVIITAATQPKTLIAIADDDFPTGDFRTIVHARASGACTPSSKILQSPVLIPRCVLAGRNDSILVAGSLETELVAAAP